MRLYKVCQHVSLAYFKCPSDDWGVGDGTKVEKVVLSLANPDDRQLVLEGVLSELVTGKELHEKGGNLKNNE